MPKTPQPPPPPIMRFAFLVHLSQMAQVHNCDHTLSVRLSVCQLFLTFHIFDFFSETAEINSYKLDRKQGLNVLYQVCGFWTDRKNKMTTLASDWLRHFWLLLWNRQTKLDRKQDLNVLCEVNIFRARWPPWPLICWDNLVFSEIAERNRTKLDRKQDLN